MAFFYSFIIQANCINVKRTKTIRIAFQLVSRPTRSMEFIQAEKVLYLPAVNLKTKRNESIRISRTGCTIPGNG